MAVWQDGVTCDKERCLSARCDLWASDAAGRWAIFTAMRRAFRQAEARAESQCLTNLEWVPQVSPMVIRALRLGDRSSS